MNNKDCKNSCACPHLEDQFVKMQEALTQCEKNAFRRYYRYNVSLDSFGDNPLAARLFSAKKAIDESLETLVAANLVETIENELLIEALSTLSEKQMRIVEMTFFRDMTQPEIAKELGISKQAVSKILMISLKKLKEILKSF